MPAVAMNAPRSDALGGARPAADLRPTRRGGSSLLPLLPMAAFVAIALAGPWLGRDPDSQALLGRLAPPVWSGGSWDNPLGTDGLGRDVLARTMHGARLSLAIGVLAAAGSALIGTILGLVGATGRGLVDQILTTAVEVMLSIPTIVVGIVLTAMIGQSLTNLLLLLTLFGWISYARIVRLQARLILRSGFIDASLAFGASRVWMTRHHLVPNVMPILLVLFCQQVAAVMLWEASLTYLGVGLPVESVSLGGMVRDGQEVIFNGWWISVLPGLMIALAVLSFTLLADWLNDRLDPVTRRSVRPRRNRRNDGVG